MKVHSSITVERIVDACERRGRSLDNPGFCIDCGQDAEGVEPDAEDYDCGCCGAKGVWGAEELLLRFV